MSKPKFFAKLILLTKKGEHGPIFFVKKQQIIVGNGNDPNSKAHVKIKVPGIDDVHAFLKVDSNGKIWLVCKNISGNTKLNDEPITDITRRELHHTDMLDFAGKKLLFEYPDGYPVPPASASKAAAPDSATCPTQIQDSSLSQRIPSTPALVRQTEASSQPSRVPSSSSLASAAAQAEPPTKKPELIPQGTSLAAKKVSSDPSAPIDSPIAPPQQPKKRSRDLIESLDEPKQFSTSSEGSAEIHTQQLTPTKPASKPSPQRAATPPEVVSKAKKPQLESSKTAVFLDSAPAQVVTASMVESVSQQLAEDEPQTQVSEPKKKKKKNPMAELNKLNSSWMHRKMEKEAGMPLGPSSGRRRLAAGVSYAGAQALEGHYQQLSNQSKRNSSGSLAVEEEAAPKRGRRAAAPRTARGRAATVADVVSDDPSDSDEVVPAKRSASKKAGSAKRKSSSSSKSHSSNENSDDGAPPSKRRKVSETTKVSTPTVPSKDGSVDEHCSLSCNGEASDDEQYPSTQFHQRQSSPTKSSKATAEKNADTVVPDPVAPVVVAATALQQPNPQIRRTLSLEFDTTDLEQMQGDEIDLDDDENDMPLTQMPPRIQEQSVDHNSAMDVDMKEAHQIPSDVEEPCPSPSQPPPVVPTPEPSLQLASDSGPQTCANDTSPALPPAIAEEESICDVMAMDSDDSELSDGVEEKKPTPGVGPIALFTSGIKMAISPPKPRVNPSRRVIRDDDSSSQEFHSAKLVPTPHVVRSLLNTLPELCPTQSQSDAMETPSAELPRPRAPTPPRRRRRRIDDEDEDDEFNRSANASAQYQVAEKASNNDPVAPCAEKAEEAVPAVSLAVAQESALSEMEQAAQVEDAMDVDDVRPASQEADDDERAEIGEEELLSSNEEESEKASQTIPAVPAEAEPEHSSLSFVGTAEIAASLPQVDASAILVPETQMSQAPAEVELPAVTESHAFPCSVGRDEPSSQLANAGIKPSEELPVAEQPQPTVSQTPAESLPVPFTSDNISPLSSQGDLSSGSRQDDDNDDCMPLTQAPPRPVAAPTTNTKPTSPSKYHRVDSMYNQDTSGASSNPRKKFSLSLSSPSKSGVMSPRRLASSSSYAGPYSPPPPERSGYYPMGSGPAPAPNPIGLPTIKRKKALHAERFHAGLSPLSSPNSSFDEIQDFDSQPAAPSRKPKPSFSIRSTPIQAELEQIEPTTQISPPVDPAPIKQTSDSIVSCSQPLPASAPPTIEEPPAEPNVDAPVPEAPTAVIDTTEPDVPSSEGTSDALLLGAEATSSQPNLLTPSTALLEQNSQNSQHSASGIEIEESSTPCSLLVAINEVAALVDAPPVRGPITAEDVVNWWNKEGEDAVIYTPLVEFEGPIPVGLETRDFSAQALQTVWDLTGEYVTNVKHHTCVMNMVLKTILTRRLENADLDASTQDGWAETQASILLKERCIDPQTLCK